MWNCQFHINFFNIQSIGDCKTLYGRQYWLVHNFCNLVAKTSIQNSFVNEVLVNAFTKYWVLQNVVDTFSIQCRQKSCCRTEAHCCGGGGIYGGFALKTHMCALKLPSGALLVNLCGNRKVTFVKILQRVETWNPTEVRQKWRFAPGTAANYSDSQKWKF